MPVATKCSSKRYSLQEEPDVLYLDHFSIFLKELSLIIRPKTLICIIMFIRLGCWCKPEGCHGDILMELVEKLCSVDETSATNENAGNAFCGNEEFPKLQLKQISSDLT